MHAGQVSGRIPQAFNIARNGRIPQPLARESPSLCWATGSGENRPGASGHETTPREAPRRESGFMSYPLLDFFTPSGVSCFPRKSQHSQRVPCLPWTLTRREERYGI